MVNQHDHEKDPNLEEDVQDPTQSEIQRILEDDDLTTEEKLDLLDQIDKDNKEGIPDDDSDLE